jgi:hypothetical protein
MSKITRLFDVVFRLSFSIYFIALLVGIYLMIIGSDVYQQTVIVGGLALSIIIINSIYEVITAIQIKWSDKLVWIVAFLLFNVLAALLYFLLRKQIRSTY